MNSRRTMKGLSMVTPPGHGKVDDKHAGYVTDDVARPHEVTGGDDS